MYLLIRVLFVSSVNYLPIITSHYVSINSAVNRWGNCYFRQFTSHYVSINSKGVTCIIFIIYNLHPTMYLLILRAQLTIYSSQSNLHPTMYLLIQKRVYTFNYVCIWFTSHYVSINSPTFFVTGKLNNLFTSHYVSINS